MPKILLFICFTLVTLCGYAQDKAVTVDFSGWNAPGLEAYQGNEKSFLVTVQNAGVAWNLTNTPPVMWWAVSNSSVSVVTGACTVVNAAAGTFRATFYPADLNTYGTFIYGVSIQSNNVTTARQGQFVIRRDPYAVGGSPITFGTNMNFSLISRYFGALSNGPYLFTGDGVTTATNAKGQVVATITPGAGSGISASTATGIVNGLAYPLTANPSNYVTASITNGLTGMDYGVTNGMASTSYVDIAVSGKVDTVAIGSAAYSNAAAFATAAQGSLADTALQPASTNGWVTSGHGAFVETNNATYTQTVALAGTALQTESDTLSNVTARGRVSSFGTAPWANGLGSGNLWGMIMPYSEAGYSSAIGWIGDTATNVLWMFGGRLKFSDNANTFEKTLAYTDEIPTIPAGVLTNNQTSVRLNTMAIHNGFEDQYAQTVSFDPVTRTAICAPTGSTFNVTAGGITYTSGAVTSSAGPEVSGNMFAYFRASDGAFICTNVAWGIIGGEAQAIYALYDHSNTSTVYVIDERHGVNISDSDHLMRHQTVGSTWASGITLSHFAQDTTAAAGANGTQTVIAVTDSGVFWDEDVKHATLANGTTANSTNTCGTFPIIWKDATTWHRDNGTVFPFFWSGDTPQYVTAAGSKTSVPEDNFFVYWLIAVGSSNGTNLFLASHPEVYSTIALAQSGATVANLSSLLGGFPNSELMVCYRLIFNHNASAPNASPASVKSVKLRAVDDYRNTPGGVILAGTGPSAGSYELTADKIAAAGGLTNNSFSINGVPVGTGSNAVVSAAYPAFSGFFGSLTSNFIIPNGAFCTISNYWGGGYNTGILNPTNGLVTVGSTGYWFFHGQCRQENSSVVPAYIRINSTFGTGSAIPNIWSTYDGAPALGYPMDRISVIMKITNSATAVGMEIYGQGTATYPIGVNYTTFYGYKIGDL